MAEFSGKVVDAQFIDHRNISKTQLVNSINKKGTVVEAVFDMFR